MGGYLNFDDDSKGYLPFGFSCRHLRISAVKVLRHLGLDGDTKLVLALSHLLDCPSGVRLPGVPELPGHADVQCR